MFILILFVSESAENEIIFSESFGTTNFSFSAGNMTLFSNDGNAYGRNYTTYLNSNSSFTSTWDNIFTGGYARGGDTLVSDFDRIRELTPVGLHFGNSACATNCIIGVAYFPDIELKLKNDSVITLSCQDSTGGLYLVFGNNNQRLVTYSIGKLSCAPVGMEDIYCKTINELYNCSASHLETYSARIDDIVSLGLGNEIENLTGITWFAIESIGGNGQNNYIDDISINFFNGSNEIPKFNVSLDNEIYCINLNESSTQIEVKYNISAFDPDGDTILYSTVTGFDLLSLFVDFNNNNCILGFFCSSIPDYGFVNNLVFASNETCRINEDNTDIEEIDNNFNVLLFNDIYSLQLEDCGKLDNTLYYKTAFPQSTIQIETNLAFSSVNPVETFNFTLYDETLKRIYLKLNFRNADGITNVSLVNSSGTFLITNTTSNPFGFTVSTFTGTALPNDFKLQVDDNPVFFEDLSLFDADSEDIFVSILGYSIDNNTDLRIQNIDFQGFQVIPTFTSVKPTEEIMTVSNLGERAIIIYVTDNIHEPDNEFRTEKVFISIVDCEKFIQPISKTDTGKGLAGLRSSLNTMCRSLEKTFSISGSFGNFSPDKYGFCFLFVVIWVIFTAIISGGFSIWIYILKKSLVMPFFLFAWSLLIISGNVILVYGIGFQILVSIIMAISGMIFVRMLFLTNEFSGGE